MRKEGEGTSLKLIQAELDINQRINEMERAHGTQISVMTQEQTNMKTAQSTLTDKCERNYHTTEKELLSIVFACEKFRTFISVSYTHLDVYKRQS